MNKKGFRRTLLATSVATLMSLSLSAHAEDLFGKISLEKGSFEGLVVQAVNVDTGTTRSISVDAEGKYRIPKLPTGVYDVTVSRGDTVVAEKKFRIRLGANTNASFDIVTDNNIEVLQVTGSRVAMIDVTSSDSGLTISADELDILPVGQSLAEVARLAPGVIKGDAAFGSDANSFGGSSAAENACYINGLEVSNTRQGLGCGSVPYQFYKDFQIKTGGYSAKYGRATGGTVNTTTKGGTNEWEFEATAEWLPDSLASSGKVSRGDNGAGSVFRDYTKDYNNRVDVTVSASGPIIEDKLFIYAIVAPRDQEDHWTTGGGRFSPVNTYRERDTSASDAMFWGAKIDWDITDNHRLSYFGYSNRTDSEISDFDYDPDTGVIGDLQNTSVWKRGGEAHSLSYTGWITEDFNVTAMVGQIKTQYESAPSRTDCPGVTDSRTTGGAEISGCAGAVTSYGANNDDNTQYRLDLEYTLGDHTISAGLDIQDRKSERLSYPTGGHNYTYLTLAPGGYFEADNGNVYNTTGAPLDYVEDRIFTGGGSFKSELAAYYVEDKWQITENLLLSLGLRIDKFKSTGTTGRTLTDFTTDPAPRLGAVWDVLGDGSSKVYGTYGTYYLPVANNTIFRAASGVSDATTAYLYSGYDTATGAPTGLTPIGGSEADSVQIGSTPVIPDKDVFQAQEADPYAKDEYILGYDQILNEEYSLGVKGTYRKVTSGLDDYCGRYAYPYCVMINPGEDMSWYADGYYWTGTDWGDSSFDADGYGDPGSLETYSAETIGLPKADNRYLAVDTQINYRGDRMRYSFTYTWSKSWGNFEGAVKSDIGQADAGITQDFDFPAVMDGAYGYQPNDRRHVFKFFGSYDLLDDLSLGWNASLSSGRPLSLFGQGYPDSNPNLNGGWGDKFYLYDADTGEYTRHPRGSNGRTPWTFNLDLNATYNFTVSDIDMKVSLNVFNILNVQEATSLNEHYESTPGVKNPYFDAAYTYQTPRYVRLGFQAKF
ncbi:TonB-dependent receptor [Shewanella mangrovi]|uniref:TonB-dependent receptor n=1 Tax=Shewanella mangrovi TaxID=1515746 RepID=A0A094JG02_9GAMM|nr:TonB-dependent receptor [Shewanella mangrovi]KFZ38840.1 TonB-dependent receptor [Shewanella mangrovi]